MAALEIEDCEAEGRVTPKEINEAVENAPRIFMEDVETRVQARREQCLREMFDVYAGAMRTVYLRRKSTGR